MSLILDRVDWCKRRLLCIDGGMRSTERRSSYLGTDCTLDKACDLLKIQPVALITTM